MEKKQLYIFKSLHWAIEYNDFGNPFAVARCPKQRCGCIFKKSMESYNRGEYKYFCPKCENKIVLAKSVEDLAEDLMTVLDSQDYKNAELVNIDGELIPVQKEEKKDDDYWVSVKISKNKKGEAQLMVLAGSRKSGNKAQLFLEPSDERLAFDQTNDHPIEVFAKVVGTFKKSQSEIISNE